jgi:hypothetical protein
MLDHTATDTLGRLAIELTPWALGDSGTRFTDPSEPTALRKIPGRSQSAPAPCGRQRGVRRQAGSAGHRGNAPGR